MMKSITYVQYAAFIRTIADNVVRYGAEQKTFWTALATAMLFFCYEPEQSENNEIDLAKVWDDLSGITVPIVEDYAEYDGEVITSDASLIEVATGAVDLESLADFPVSIYVYSDMLAKTDEIISERKKRAEREKGLEAALVKLVNTVDQTLESLRNSFDGADLKEISEKAGGLGGKLTVNGEGTASGNDKDKKRQRA